MMKEKKEPLIYRLIKRAGGAIGSAIRKSNERGRLSKSKAYNAIPDFKGFEIKKSINGEYSIFEKSLYNESLVGIIFGKRGSGKSAMGFRILENIYFKTKRKCFALGIKQELIPKWISPIESVENTPQGSVILIDEGAIEYSARESMKLKNKEIGKILATARHKNLTVIFITQNTGLIDKNIIKLSDFLLIKEGSLLQLEMERPEIKKFYDKSREVFSKLEGDKKKFAYLIDSNFEGVISYDLPGFWSDNLSKNQNSR